MIDVAKRHWRVSRNNWHPLFSNFAPTPIVVKFDGMNLEAVTGEHAFQALKALDPGEGATVLAARTPGEAKARGRRVALRPGWDGGLAIEVMRAVVQAKYWQHADFRDALDATASGIIIEVTTWNDTVWGTNQEGFGANQLGQLLMEVRDS